MAIGFYINLIILALFGLLSGLTSSPAAGEAEAHRYKILHVMSYHSPWRWTDDQLSGFKEGLGVAAVEYKVFQMDTKLNSTPPAKQQKAKQAMALIKKWQPDLVYTTDDDAQEYVTSHYINAPIPFVFSGVNTPPVTYGFAGSSNIAGVREQEHFVETINLITSIDPSIKKVAVVFDDAPMWPSIQSRMKESLSKLGDIDFITWDTILTFADYKQKIKTYQTSVDAIALIGVFNFKDDKGQNVTYEEVLRWTSEASQLPDFSFWEDRVHFGTLAAVSVSAREQGIAAGNMARAILVDGKSPADIPFQTTTKGVPIINLARAKKLGIKIKSSLLLSAKIIQSFEWDE